MNKKKISFFMNFIIFIFCSTSLLYYINIFRMHWTTTKVFSFHIGNILLLLIAFVVLHALKFARYYLIFSENHISLINFFQLYIKTTLVNVIIPFKLGEIYRFYAFGNMANNYYISFLSLITERFYDTSVVLIFLLVQILFYNGTVGSVFFMFFIFVAGCFLIYQIYPKTGQYLTHFFVMKNDKHRDIVALKFIDRLNFWYSNEKNIINGKGSLIFILSFLAWIADYIFLMSLSKFLSIPFGFLEFCTYIKSILNVFPSYESPLNLLYILVTTILFIIIEIIFLMNRKVSK